VGGGKRASPHAQAKWIKVFLVLFFQKKNCLLAAFPASPGLLSGPMV
jgi:hypothetical protein